MQNIVGKLLVRRGTTAERMQVVLSEGELGLDLDLMELFIGDGVTLGGIATGTSGCGDVAGLLARINGLDADLGTESQARKDECDNIYSVIESNRQELQNNFDGLDSSVQSHYNTFEAKLGALENNLATLDSYTTEEFRYVEQDITGLQTNLTNLTERVDSGKANTDANLATMQESIEILFQSYLPNTGGSVTGNLSVTGELKANAAVRSLNTSAILNSGHLNTVQVKNSEGDILMQIPVGLGVNGSVIRFVNHSHTSLTLQPQSGVTLYVSTGADNGSPVSAWSVFPYKSFQIMRIDTNLWYVL